MCSITSSISWLQYFCLPWKVFWRSLEVFWRSWKETAEGMRKSLHNVAICLLCKLIFVIWLKQNRMPLSYANEIIQQWQFFNDNFYLELLTVVNGHFSWVPGCHSWQQHVWMLKDLLEKASSNMISVWHQEMKPHIW